MKGIDAFGNACIQGFIGSAIVGYLLSTDRAIITKCKALFNYQSTKKWILKRKITITSNQFIIVYA